MKSLYKLMTKEQELKQKINDAKSITETNQALKKLLKVQEEIDGWGAGNLIIKEENKKKLTAGEQYQII